MKAVKRNQPIGMRYSLDKMEKLILRDLSRLEEQLEQVESNAIGNNVRLTTANTYRKMIADRKSLLEQIQAQSREFLAG